MTKLFFATDVHGSDICWGRFLNVGKFYGADLLILGGDMTSKAVVPFFYDGGGDYRISFLDQVFDTAKGEEIRVEFICAPIQRMQEVATQNNQFY
jgi:uncharacterized protein